MTKVASEALAAQVTSEERAAGLLFPSVSRLRAVSFEIAAAVAHQAIQDGVADCRTRRRRAPRARSALVARLSGLPARPSVAARCEPRKRSTARIEHLRVLPVSGMTALGHDDELGARHVLCEQAQYRRRRVEICVAGQQQRRHAQLAERGKRHRDGGEPPAVARALLTARRQLEPPPHALGGSRRDTTDRAREARAATDRTRAAAAAGPARDSRGPARCRCCWRS